MHFKTAAVKTHVAASEAGNAAFSPCNRAKHLFSHPSCGASSKGPASPDRSRTAEWRCGVTVVLALAISCKSQHDAPTPEPTSPTNTPAPAAVSAPKLDTDAIQLVAPGAEPRHVVRYQLVKGTTATIEMALDTTLVSGGQGGAMPTMIFELDMRVEDVASNGSYRFRSTITGVHARDRDGAKVQASQVDGKLDAMSGVAIVGTLATDGQISDARVELGGKTVPDTLAAQLASLAQSMHHIATPLPSEPIGVGAVWKTTRDIDENGLKASSISTVTVRAIDDHTLTLDTASELHGADQQITQQNTTIAVSQIGGSGSGHAVVDVSKLAMNAELESSFHANMKAMGQDAPVTMQLKISISSK